MRQVALGERAAPGQAIVPRPAQDHRARRRLVFFQRHEQRTVTPGVFGVGRVELRKRALGRHSVARLAGQAGKALQRERRDAVSRGRGVVVARLGTLDQPLVVVAGEIKPAAVPVLELVEQHLGQIRCETEQVRVEIRLHQLDQRKNQVRVIVEIRVEMRAPVLRGGEQTLVPPHLVADESERLLRRLQPVVAAEHRRRARHPGNHERVPAHQHLLVAPGAHACLASGEELVPCRVEQARAFVLAPAQALRHCGQRLHDAQMPMRILEIGRSVQAVTGREHRVLVRRNEGSRLLRGPHVEFAFFVLRVGVERGVVAAFRGLHFAHHPARSLLGNAREQRIARRCPGLGVQAQQRAVVVEHFLEVRDLPFRVHAVAGKPAPQLVVDAAERHALEGICRDALRRVVAGGRMAPQAQLELGRVRKLRGAAETAVPRIEARLQAAQRGVYRLRCELRMMRGGARLHVRQRLEQGRVLLADLAAAFAPRLRDALEQLRKAGQVEARFLGEVRAAEERRAVGREHHGERPAPGAPRQHLVGELVDLVEVGSLLAIHLDVDEQPVHDFSDRFVLEGFVRHHVDRLVLVARAPQRFLAPGVPIHGVVRVLLQVRAGFLRETVGHGKGAYTSRR